MNKFDLRLQKLPPSISMLLSELDKLNGQWIGGANLNPQALGRLKRSVLVTSTGASTRIEGARLTDTEIEKLMRGLLTQKLANRDVQEVKGYYELLKMVFDSYTTMGFSENLIRQLHSELLKYVNKDERHRGDYKKQENQVEMKDATGNVLSVLFETTPAYLTAKEMNELMEWTKDSLDSKTYHPVLVICSFIIEFLKIHPFLDGNGRLSRVLTNLLMIQSGYEFMPYISHEKIIENSKTDYYLALRQSQITFNGSSETIEPWAVFFINALQEQAEKALYLLSDDSIEKLLSPNQLAVWGCFNNVKKEMSVKQIVEATGVARPTVKQALERLLELRKIQRIGLGRSTRYRRNI